MSPLAAVVIFCGVLCSATCFGEPGKHFSKWIRTANNGESDNKYYSFDQVLSVSVKNCFKACKSTKACQYVNYEVRSHTCYLIRGHEIPAVSGVTPEEVESKPGYVLGVKSEWLKEENEVCDSCDDTGSCSVDDDNKDYSSCRHSGCGLPRKYNNSEFKSNMFSEGSKVLYRYTCNEGFKVLPPNIASSVSTCLQNGSWSDVTFKCVPESTVCSNRKCYYPQFENLSREDAMIKCETMGSYLVAINTADEQHFIENNLFKNDVPKWIWTGGHNLTTGSKTDIRWPDNTEVSYTNWEDTIQPNNPDYQRCLLLRNDFKWRSFNCTSEHASICEFNDIP